MTYLRPEFVVSFFLSEDYWFRFGSVPEWDPMASDFYSARNRLTLDTENYDSATTGHVPQDDHRICRFYRATGNCHKGLHSSSCLFLYQVSLRNETSPRLEVPSFRAVFSSPSLHFLNSTLRSSSSSREKAKVNQVYLVKSSGRI